MQIASFKLRILTHNIENFLFQPDDHYTAVNIEFKKVIKNILRCEIKGIC